MRKHPHHARRSAFTLVELLVVVSIVTILAALGTVAAYAAIRSARQSAITNELTQLEMALEEYNTSIGDYPPDGANRNLTQRHIASYYRRVGIPASGIDATAGTPFLPYFDTVNLPANQRIDQSEALVFWLALVGTSKQYPFINPLPPSAAPDYEPVAAKLALQNSSLRRFEFKPDRLIDPDGDGWPSYCPEYTDLSPYVYFHHDTYDLDFSATVNLAAYGHPAGNGVARPYGATGGAQFLEPRKFQIISTGLDGYYSNAAETVGTDVFKTYPDGTNYTLEDEDNLTSFSEGKTLGDQRP
ncbi:MAG: type II secretion system protein [Pirellulaceae bacterium]